MKKRNMGSKRSDKTIARILKAATQVFAENGFDGARVDMIAEVADVNKATIYYHIGDKKALYCAVLHAVFGERADYMAKQVKTVHSPEDQLKIIFATFYQLMNDSPHVSAIMMHEMASGAKNFPDILVEDFTHIIGLIAGALQEGNAIESMEKVHPMVIYLMGIASMSFYEKIYRGLREPLNSGSQKLNVPVISFQEFAEQSTALILRSIKKSGL